MRVIAGRFKGRALAAPEGLTTRPITDRAKETLFNILGSRLGSHSELPDVEVLDVFAGTGGLGIESLSRGARACTFIEKDRAALAALRQNLQTLRLEPGVATISAVNAWKLGSQSLGAGRFGLAFLDPPYRDTASSDSILDLLRRVADCMTPAGLVVFRSPLGVRIDAGDAGGLQAVDERELGSMRFLFLQGQGRPTPPESGYHACDPFGQAAEPRE